MVRTICFVTPNHMSTNPRLVKEARAAAAAGHRVRVVFSQADELLARYDAEILRDNPSWNAGIVSWMDRPGAAGRLRRWSRLRRRVCEAAFARTRLPVFGVRALARVHDELLAAARREPADLFVAHNLAALPVAAAAAARHGARLGFDAEDFHRGELPASAAGSATQRLVEWMERTYIPRCDYVTAAAPGIADAYARALAIPRPEVILNVFDLDERDVAVPPETLAAERVDRGRSLVWFSQTIGPDRGLDDVLAALPRLDGVHLYLRGRWAPGFEDEFTGQARALGVVDRLHVHGPVSPDWLVPLMARHDVGLALEQPVTVNRELCITNKLYTYLLAGIPVVASATAGQRAAVRDTPGAALLYEPGHPEQLADAVRALLSDAGARARALRLAVDRLNWNVESRRFLAILDRVLGARAGYPAAAPGADAVPQPTGVRG